MYIQRVSINFAITKLRLTDQFKQNWHSTLQISPKALSYRLFKSYSRFEKYLDVLNDRAKIDCVSYVNLARLVTDEFHYVLQVPH
jgi:hypothetical protein